MKREDHPHPPNLALRQARDLPPGVDPVGVGRAGTGLARRVQARVDHLRRMDDFIGGGDLHAVLTRELDDTAALIRHSSHSTGVRVLLLRAAGELCQLTGWALDDAGRHEQAARHYHVGMRAAQAAADAPLAANLLSTLSYQVANMGKPADAVVLARSALRGADGHATPLVRALLWDRVAWAHARDGDLAAVQHALDKADEAYGQRGSADEPEWVYWLDRAELDVMAGRCFVELNQPARAEPLLAASVARYDHAREAALYRSWLAQSHIQAGDVERACAEATRVLDLAAGVNSARAAERLAALHTALRPHAATRAVKDFDHRYQER